MHGWGSHKGAWGGGSGGKGNWNAGSWRYGNQSPQAKYGWGNKPRWVKKGSKGPQAKGKSKGSKDQRVLTVKQPPDGGQGTPANRGVGGGISWGGTQFQPRKYYETEDMIQPRMMGTVTDVRKAQTGYDGEIDVAYADSTGTITYRSLHFHSTNWLSTTCLAMEEAYKQEQLVGTQVSFFIDSYYTPKKGTRGTALGMTFVTDAELKEVAAAAAVAAESAQAETGNTDNGTP